jgi:hypothetical protein
VFELVAQPASTTRRTSPRVAIFLLGENPAVYGGSESDTSPTIHRRLQAGYSTLIHTIK